MKLSKLITPRSMFALFSIAFLVQSAHHAEHVTQMIQIYVLGQPLSDANGLLGEQFNFEWVHFVYNVTLELGIIALWWGYRRLSKRTNLEIISQSMPLFILLVIGQGYHALEHIIRMIQYIRDPIYQLNGTLPPGLIGIATDWSIPVIHFWINMVVWSLMVLIVVRLHATFWISKRIHINSNIGNSSNAY